MTDQQQGYATGVVFVLAATLGWSLSGVFVRFMPGLSGWQINCWRGYWVGVSLLIYLVAIYGRDTPAKFKAIPLLGLLTSAGFFTLGSTLYVTSLTLVSTATIAVIGASSPIFTGLLSPWVTGEKPGFAAWAAALMAMAGVGIIAWHGLEAGNLAGMLVSIMVPICFAGQTLALRRYRHIDMVPAICVGGFLSFLVAGFLGMIGAIGGSPGGGFAVGLREVALLAFMGVVQLAIPLIFYARGARSVAAITLSLIVMLDAVINPLWPWLALGETPGRTDFIGGAVIIGAVVISIFGSRWQNRN